MIPATQDMPDWFPALMAHYAQPEQPSLKDAHARLCAELPDDVEAPRYWQARLALRQFDDMMSGRAH